MAWGGVTVGKRKEFYHDVWDVAVHLSPTPPTSRTWDGDSGYYCSVCFSPERVAGMKADLADRMDADIRSYPRKLQVRRVETEATGEVGEWQEAEVYLFYAFVKGPHVGGRVRAARKTVNPINGILRWMSH